MVATVGSIAVDLSANTAKFTAGFQKAATTVDRESKRMSNAISGFSKKASGIGSAFIGGIVAGGTLAAISSLAGAIGKARQSLSDFEEIGNRAKATGLSTDTFQAISHGAALADVEQESLNKSLEIFAKNAGLAEQGAGAMYAGLKKLNPELLLSVLHATDQEERLKLVADAMAGMTDATEKAALATAVFGKGGAEMVRVLDQGSQSIEAMKQNAKDLGIIIPEDLIARSGALDDKLTTLAKVIEVNLSEALVKAAPLLVAAAEGMVKLAKGANAASNAYNAFMEVLHPEPVAVLNDELYTTQVRMKEVGDEVRVAEAELAKLKADLVGAPAAIVEVQTAEAQAKIDGLRAQLDDLDAHAKDIKVTMDTEQARAAIDQLRSSDLAALNADDAARANRPRVHRGGTGGTGGTGTGRSGGATGGDGSGGFDPEFLRQRANSDAILEYLRGQEGRWGTTYLRGGQETNKLLQGGNDLAQATEADIEEAIANQERGIKTTENGVDVTRYGLENSAQIITGSIDRNGYYVSGRFEEATSAQTNALLGGLGGSFRDMGTALRSIPWNQRTMAAANESTGFRFSGLGNADSWAGKRLTIGGGSTSMHNRFGKGFWGTTDPALSMGTSGIEGTSTITSGGGAAINVNVTVRPILEGTRLSAQSAAEIKQAASAGANAALRAFNGR